MNILNQISIREMNSDDVNFVYNSWLKSFRNSLEAMNQTNEVYYDNHKNLIEKLLNKSNVNIIHPADDPSHILGFMCSEGNIVHYIYIKYNYRKLGIAKHLLTSIVSGDTFYITHITKNIRDKVDNQKIVYNPWLR